MSDILNFEKAIPNKLLNNDGSVTDFLGRKVEGMVPEFANKRALPNKFLNSDGTYSTITEILSASVGSEIFIVTNALPTTGEENKIYLVPAGDGSFNEHYWNGSSWDNFGIVNVDMSNYPTTDDVNAAINAAIYNTLGGEY